MNRKYYKDIIDLSLNGCAYHKIVLDNEGKPIDYIFLDVNPAFEKFTGLVKDNIIGKKVTEVIPDIVRSDFNWIESYGKVALTGETLSIKQYSEPFKKWYNIHAFSNETGYFATIFNDITGDIDEKEAQDSLVRDILVRSADDYKTITNLTGDIIFQADVYGYWTFLNDIACQFWGDTRNNLLGRSIIDYLYVDDQKETLEALDTMVQSGSEIKGFCNRQMSKEGWRIVEWNAAPIYRSGKYAGFQATGRDITAQKEIEVRLKEKETELEEAQGMAKLGRWDYYHLENKLCWADTIYSIFEQDKHNFEVSYEGFLSKVHPEDRRAVNSAWEKSLASKEPYSIEHRLLMDDGRVKWLKEQCRTNFDEDGRPVRSIGVVQDITEIKEKQIEIEYLSFHDHLTGLYNRRFFEIELNRLDTKRNLPLSIIVGDVNGLKLINDSFGHAVGDKLLIKMGKIIKKACREDDIIARVGGDEYAIVLPGTKGEEAEKVINRIRDLSIGKKIGGLDISASFGYATKENENESIDSIYKEAEDIMYNNKLFEGPGLRSRVVDNIINAVNSKNSREETHSKRVSQICEAVAIELGLDDVTVKEYGTLGLLHDIGKIAIPDEILNKQSVLTEQEYVEMKRHSEIGYRILTTVGEMNRISEYVLLHHERWDGKGYPKGIRGEEVPLPARVCAIADAYDAMTSERSYRPAKTKEFAIKELEQNSGTQFDPKLVRIFIDKIINKNCIK